MWSRSQKFEVTPQLAGVQMFVIDCGSMSAAEHLEGDLEGLVDPLSPANNTIGNPLVNPLALGPANATTASLRACLPALAGAIPTFTLVAGEQLIVGAIVERAMAEGARVPTIRVLDETCADHLVLLVEGALGRYEDHPALVAYHREMSQKFEHHTRQATSAGTWLICYWND